MFFEPYAVQEFYDSVRNLLGGMKKRKRTTEGGYPPWYVHPLDGRVRLEEKPKHAYFLDGSTEGLVGVTSLLETLFEPFDPDDAIRKMAQGRSWQPSHRWWTYNGRWKELKDRWASDAEEACRRGKAVHAYIQEFFESILRGENPMDIERPPEKDFKWSQLAEFLHHHRHLTPYRFEWSICDLDSGICGTVDALFLREDGDFELYDWKTYGDIETENRWQRGRLFDLTAHIQDTNLEHARLQTHAYRKILSSPNYRLLGGGKIVKLGVVVFHPDNDSYVKIDLTDDGTTEDVIGALFRRRARQFSRPKCTVQDYSSSFFSVDVGVGGSAGTGVSMGGAGASERSDLASSPAVVTTLLFLEEGTISMISSSLMARFARHPNAAQHKRMAPAESAAATVTIPIPNPSSNE
jgi:hypothetical protein